MPLNNLGTVAFDGGKTNKYVFRSAQPDGDGLEMLRDTMGVRSIVRLSGVDEGPLSYVCEMQYFERFPDCVVVSQPMPGLFRAAETEHVIKICKLIKEMLPRGNVLVHCLHGVDRTSLVCACFQMMFAEADLATAMAVRKVYGVGDIRDCLDFEDHPVLNAVWARVQAGEFKDPAPQKPAAETSPS